MKRFQDKPPVAEYDLAAPTADKRWSGVQPIPAIGARVTINFNSLGSGVVESYFYEHGFQGVCVKLDAIPEWKQKQQKTNADVALVFGMELK